VFGFQFSVNGGKRSQTGDGTGPVHLLYPLAQRDPPTPTGHFRTFSDIFYPEQGTLRERGDRCDGGEEKGDWDGGDVASGSYFSCCRRYEFCFIWYEFVFFFARFVLHVWSQTAFFG